MRAFLKRSNVIAVDVDVQVAEIAASIRGVTILANESTEPPPKTVQMPDALIVATAILYDVSVLHTFDPNLVNRSGTDLFQGLTVSPPVASSGQRSLLED